MSIKIVIVEDEIRIREGMEKLIKKLDDKYEIVGTAENGREGAALVRNVQPDVIVTDIRMPLMDGLEMLTQLYGEGYAGKAVVLSAYSEFEYARQAMRLGVKEYLLKPIVVGDLSEALSHVSEEIRRENAQERLTLSSAAQIFEGLLWGNLEADEPLKKLLAEEYKIHGDTCYTEFCFYLGDFYEKEKMSVRMEAERMLQVLGDFSWQCLESERNHMMVFLLYGSGDVHEAERFIQKEMLQWREKKPFEGIGWNTGLRLENLREGLAQIEQYLEWNISLGDEVLISYPKVTGIITGPCIYPLELESRMKLHICSGDREALDKDISGFRDYFQKGGLYAPREIKECYVRFLWAMINIAKETGMMNGKNLEQQSLLEQITGAKTRRALREAVDSLVESICRKEEREAADLTIKRVQSLIQEFYQSGITLDEIAAKLNMTPEYLGTRFHKEVGVTFSTYIKNYRMSKAKGMLIGTSMKLYEIAAKTGYSDPKYFSRVFKEATGQLPAEYRKTHK